MSTQQSNGGVSNAHADEHGSAGGSASLEPSQAAVPPGQAQLEASPEKGHTSVNPRQAQLPAPPEEAQAAVPPGQAQLPAPSASSEQLSSLSEGLTGDTDMYDAGAPYKPSDSDRRCMITDILSAPDDPNKIQRAWEKNIPDNCNLNYKQLMAILHPDRVPTSDKADAQKAFQRVQWAGAELEKLFPGQVNKNHHFFQGGGSASQPHVEEDLCSYHKAAHEEATQHIVLLYIGLQKNPSVNIHQGPLPEEIRKPAEVLDEINKKIQHGNLQMKKEPELGIIRYTELLGAWRPIFLSPELASSQMQMIKKYCDQFHYPKEWADITHLQKAAGSFHPSASQPQSSQASTSQPHSNQVSTSYSGSNQAGRQLQHVSTGSNKRTIALAPRQVVRSISPGYTSTGERIRMIQQLGIMGARFVVEDGRGRIRLMSSSATGGQLAIDGARSAGVPDTLRGDEALISLRNLIRTQFGGTYGLNWVAVGEVDPMHDKFPSTLVGFFFEGPNGNPPLKEVGLSRSALKKIISAQEADRLISEVMTCDSNVALKDAISGLSGLSLKSGENSSQLPEFGLPTTPQASLLGYNQQTAQGSVFGSYQQPHMQQPAQGSLFGSNQHPAQQTAQNSLFGSYQQPQTQQGHNQQMGPQRLGDQREGPEEEL
ncbi:hypothetical protein N7530_009736 [Penicillium desertorum]|uniref:J domain-containing protein n=1 Tax=Penicillium desertorum TaxID=1303715 RepID=A0A9W9WJ26_9EURO|nr:hypothetical protein N7530_009736 [Penicillium desertorum]